jgi:hypothetical protein
VTSERNRRDLTCEGDQLVIERLLALLELGVEDMVLALCLYTSLVASGQRTEDRGQGTRSYSLTRSLPVYKLSSIRTEDRVLASTRSQALCLPVSVPD